jgi:hypothetical protein
MLQDQFPLRVPLPICFALECGGLRRYALLSSFCEAEPEKPKAARLAALQGTPVTNRCPSILPNREGAGPARVAASLVERNSTNADAGGG